MNWNDAIRVGKRRCCRSSDHFSSIVHIARERIRPAESSEVKYLSSLPTERADLRYSVKSRQTGCVDDSVLGSTHHEILISCTNRDAIRSAERTQVFDFAVVPDSCEIQNWASSERVNAWLL